MIPFLHKIETQSELSGTHGKLNGLVLRQQELLDLENTRFINLGQPRGRACSSREQQQLKLEQELDKVFQLMLLHKLIEGLKVIDYYLLHLFHSFVQEILHLSANGSKTIY